MLRMEDNENIRDFYGKMMGLVNQLRLLGRDITEERLVNKMLVSLLEKYESKVSSLEDSRDLAQVTLKELVNALEVLEQRRVFRQRSAADFALVAKTKNVKMSGNSFKGSAVDKKSKGKNFGENRQGDKKKEFPPCPHYKKTNHTEKFCCECKAAVVEQVKEDTDEVIFMATIRDDSSKTNIWLLNSACSHHLTGNKSLFTTLDTSFKSKVKIGDGNYLDILGIGTVNVDTVSRSKTIISVHYVPSANHNLLSVGQLGKEHYALLFKDEVCIVIYPNGDELCTVAMKNNCYPLNLASIAHMALYNELDMSEIWHRKFGHVNYSFLSFMSLENLVEGLLGITKPNKLCSACQFEKQSRKPFPKVSRWKSTRKLELVHIDLSGPMKTLSLSGSKFYIVFIDDFTRLYDPKLNKVFVSRDVVFDEDQSWNWPNARANQFDFTIVVDNVDPSEIHFATAKRVLRYVKGIVDYGLVYMKQKSSQLQKRLILLHPEAANCV
ncbi:Uncharacterized protein TCM_024849 [Theobroma cacao]|uniref:Uncharacterized protein n=1 Tax=Theobroma cacao TaxID=3641 RepID=A0A061EX95_THECC|nr:Uncharacterized protein TCM_024849 [Theobroma cacao]